jgi:surface protein
MSGMFKNATSFNNGGSSDINNWNTALVTNMIEMFSGAVNFNQPIGNWNTSLVTSMFAMFFGAINFDRPLTTSGSSWNVSNVSNMSGMFYNAFAFNQPLSSWNISNVLNITNFMAGKSFTNYTASYLDDIYNAWAALTVKPNLNISFGVPPNGIKYTLAGAPGRASLISTDNWSITDGGI